MSLRLVFAALVFASAAVVVSAASTPEQDSLNRAKDYYASASYDEALQVLGQLREKAPAAGQGVDMTEVAAYQMLCLVALGRNQEATEAIAAIVRSDPTYRPSESAASPRVRSFFDKVRQPMLPALVRQMYASAKDSLQKKEMADAAQAFDRVVALIDDMGPTDDSVADLRTLAVGFRDLSHASIPAAKPAEAAAVAPVPAPAPAALPPTGPAPQPTLAEILSLAAVPKAPETRVYTANDADVIKPVAISRVLPTWRPTNNVERLQSYRGSVDLVIDSQGRVTRASIAKSVNRDYDPLLLRAAAGWEFQPATRNGTPVPYRYAIDVVLSAPGR